MPGTKCQYVGCLKTTVKFPQLHMFRFPKNEAQQETWLMNCGKLQNNIFFNYYILIYT